MSTPRHRPPSRARYAANHPSLTVHFDSETHARVVALRGTSGLSLNQLVRQALGSLERHVETIAAQGHARGIEEGRAAGYADGHKVGFRKAVATYRLTYPCAECGRLMALRVGDEDAEAALEFLTASQWKHSECPQDST